MTLDEIKTSIDELISVFNRLDNAEIIISCLLNHKGYIQSYEPYLQKLIDNFGLEYRTEPCNDTGYKYYLIVDELKLYALCK